MVWTTQFSGKKHHFFLFQPHCEYAASISSTLLKILNFTICFCCAFKFCFLLGLLQTITTVFDTWCHQPLHWERPRPLFLMFFMATFASFLCYRIIYFEPFLDALLSVGSAKRLHIYKNWPTLYAFSLLLWFNPCGFV